MEIKIGEFEPAPKRRRGRPLVPPDADLMGALYALVDTLEKGWPFIGWELECIRNAPNPPPLEALRAALEPIKDWSHNYIFLFLLSASVEQTTSDDLQQLRNELGQAVSAARAGGTAVEEQTKLCQEAAAALEQAGLPAQKEIITKKKAELDADLNRLQNRLLEANERLKSLEMKLRAREAFFTQSQALGFLRSRRYELTPRNLASAIAGCPYILWRTSILRCKKIGCRIAESTNYLVVLAVMHILKRGRPKTNTEAVQLFQNEIPKLPNKKHAHTKEFLAQNWSHFKRAIEEHWECCPHPGRLSYDLAAAFIENITRPTGEIGNINLGIDIRCRTWYLCVDEEAHDSMADRQAIG